MEAGSCVYGSLVPWNNEWYWSGAQHILAKNLSKDTIDELRADLSKQSSIIYAVTMETIFEIFTRTCRLSDAIFTVYKFDYFLAKP
ncbi:hypothetical protein JXA70_00785 [candidate division KSB1 bacterium]|nr:hypothetical protein [candidate division KSB1 bacterium]